MLLAVHVGLPLARPEGRADRRLRSIDVALGLVLLSFLVRETLAGARRQRLRRRVLVVGARACELDANKMTAGVFRHGDLASSRDATVLFSKDGKTATVHLVQYPEAISLRTNGKSDGSINLDRDGERGTDEITMVLTGALPLALQARGEDAPR